MKKTTSIWDLVNNTSGMMRMILARRTGENSSVRMLRLRAQLVCFESTAGKAGNSLSGRVLQLVTCTDISCHCDDDAKLQPQIL
jgi:hypothetical protein